MNIVVIGGTDFIGCALCRELVQQNHRVALLTGTGFLADLSVAWENKARRAETVGVRVVRLRIGMALEKDGGALPKMLPPFRAS